MRLLFALIAALEHNVRKVHPLTVHPVPEHGTEARYQSSTHRPGCYCRRCTTGWTRAGQLRQLARLEGRPATIPAQPVTERVAALHAAGMSTYDIATSAMVNTSTVVSHAALYAIGHGSTTIAARSGITATGIDKEADDRGVPVGGEELADGQAGMRAVVGGAVEGPEGFAG